MSRIKEIGGHFVHAEKTEAILGCCFEVVKELGYGLSESVYKKALRIVLIEKGLEVEEEKHFEVVFRGQQIGSFYADLVVENQVIIELKCCSSLLPEHQAQLINYLKLSDIQVGLLVNFGKRQIEYKRTHHPDYPNFTKP